MIKTINKSFSAIDTLPSIEKRKILVQYRKLQDTFVGRINKQEQAKVKEGLVYLLNYHRNTGYNSINCIIHSLKVAQIVSKEIGLGTISILSALLHNVVGDTRVSINDISKKFGTEVSKLVQSLASIKNVFEWSKTEDTELFKKLASNFIEDCRIIPIKIADRLDNMRSIRSLPRYKQLKIANDTKQIYIPLAYWLGLDNIRAELENSFLRYAHLEVYKNLSKEISSRNSKDIDKFIKSIEHMLKKHGLKFRIQKRTKTTYSTWRKVTKYNIPLTQVYDIKGLRIILSCSTKEEKTVCWATYGIVTELYKPHPKRLRNWISRPKPNGYASLHTTVMYQRGEWIEVQIRTERMNKIATLGPAAYWKYKRDPSLGFNIQVLEQWINNTRSFLRDIQDKGCCIKK